jgi:hypothetical protein
MGADVMSTFALGHVQVRRSGYGAMQLAGPFAFGAPPDRASAMGVLRAAVAAGVDHIDTAQYYGPGVVNNLIREALYPYPDGLAIVSKVAVRRDDSGAVLPFDDPDQLREGANWTALHRRLGERCEFVDAGATPRKLVLNHPFAYLCGSHGERRLAAHIESLFVSRGSIGLPRCAFSRSGR